MVQSAGQLTMNQGRDHNVHGFTTLLRRRQNRHHLRGDGRFRSPRGGQAGSSARFARDGNGHLLGIDHTRLTYRYSGRDFRLTDVAGNVLRDVLA